METDTRLKVVEAYVREFGNPMKASSGEEVEILKKNDGKYREWYWCRSGDGTESWVPQQVIRISGNMATFSEDYDATELTVDIGDVLTLIHRMGGWAWCLDSRGQRGWVPLENVETL